jgi:hypothetical protein
LKGLAIAFSGSENKKEEICISSFFMEKMALVEATYIIH